MTATATNRASGAWTSRNEHAMNTPPRRLLAAAALSVAAHAALLAGSWLTPPEPVPELPPLSARLEPLPPPPQPAAHTVTPQRPPPPRERLAVAPRTIA